MKSNMQKNKLTVAALTALFAASGYIPSLAATWEVSDFSGTDGFSNAFENGQYQEASSDVVQQIQSGDTILMQGNINSTSAISQGVNNIILDGNNNTYSGNRISVDDSDLTLTIKNITFTDTSLTNNGETTLNNVTAASIVNLSELNTEGTTTINGTISGGNGTIKNTGTLNVNGASSALGEVTNSNVLNISGNNSEIKSLTQNTGSTTVNANTAVTLNGGGISGGSITNNGSLDVAGGTISGGTVTNSGTFDVSGGTISGGTVTNSGTLDVSGGTISGGSVTNNNVLNISGGAINSDAVVAINGNTNLSGNGALYLNSGDTLTSGTISQTGANSTLSLDGVSTSASGTSVNTTAGNVVLKNGTMGNSSDSIGANAKVTIGNETLNAGEYSLGSDDTWDGKITLTGATLNMNGVNQNGSLLDAQSGTLKLENGNITIGTGSQIADTVNTTLNSMNLSVTSGGSVTLNSGDTLDKAALNLNGGNLTLNSIAQNGSSLVAESGSLTVQDVALTLGAGQKIDSSVTASLTGGSLTVSGGSVSLNSGDTWTSDTNLTSGTLSVENITKSSGIKASGGTFNMGTGADITLSDANDVISSDATVNLDNGAKITVSGGSLELNGTGNGADTLSNGTISVTNGNFSMSNLNTSDSVSLSATGGNVNLNNVAFNNANDSVASDAAVTVNGDITLNKGALELNAGDTLTSGTITLGTGSNGTVTLDNISTGNSVGISAQGGNVTLKNATLESANNIITSAANVAVDNGVTVSAGRLELDNTDTITGAVTVKGNGSVLLDSISTDTTKNVNAEGGSVEFKNFTFDSADDYIASGAEVTLNGTTTIKNSTSTDNGITLGSDDTWNGSLALEGGSLYLNGVNQNGQVLNATGGTLQTSGQTLVIGTGSQIAEHVNAALNGGSLEIKDTGSVILNSGDTLNTVTTLNGGTLDLKGASVSGENSVIKAETGTFILENGQEYTVKTTTGGTSYIKEAVEVTIKDDSKLNIENGTVVLDSSDTLESGTTSLSGGTLTLKEVSTNDNYHIETTGGNLTVTTSATLTNALDTIGKDTKVTVNGTLEAQDGVININGNDVWTGDNEIKVTGGTLNYENRTTNGKITAESGELNILGSSNNTILNVASGSKIEEDAAVTIEGGLKINGETAEVSLNDTDNLNSGYVELTSGNLVMSGLSTKNTYLKATGGYLTLNSVELNNDNDDIEFAADTTIDGDVTITHGRVELDAEDHLLKDGAVITLNGENATLGVDGFSTDTTNISLQKGTLEIVNRGLTLNNDSDVIEQEIRTIVDGNLTINAGKVYLNEDDSWNSGIVKVSNSGILQFENFTKTGADTLIMDGADSTVELINSNVTVNNAQNISDGTLNIDNTSKLTLVSGEMNLATLNSSGSLTTLNGTFDDHTIANLNVINSDFTKIDGANTFTGDSQADFAIDLYARLRDSKQDSDTFTGETLGLLDPSGTGTVNISDWVLRGHLTRKDAPIDRYYNFKIFNYDDIDPNITFTATDKETFTPIGYYRLFGNSDGTYTLGLTRYNPQVFRAQVTTLAQYNNQLAIDDIVTNHVILHNERKLADMGGNKYAAATPTLGPYLYSQEDGGLWIKSYGDIERLSMTQELNVHNVSYGTIVGADFPLVNLKDGWKFIPTTYMGYNGAHQSFNDVSAYQNGGQLGFMGTFMKDNFISSHTIYGGGFYNEMHVDYVTDKTANWFWGTAHRLAYNWNIKKHFIFQPTAFISYNMFGEQNFHTEFGDMGMKSGMLNGVNIAPGLNLIYLKNDWSLYGGIQYMYNINEQVSGRAGNIDLPNMNMRHGYVQYGVGGTKNIKDDLAMYGQVMFRNGGRTGVAFQLGLQYYFDIHEIGSKAKNAVIGVKNKIFKK